MIGGQAMAGDFESSSRVNRFDKKRKNTKLISALVGIGALLLIVFLVVLFWDNGEEQEQAMNDEDQQDENINETEEESEKIQIEEVEEQEENIEEEGLVVSENDEETTESDEEEDSSSNEESGEEETVESDDDNVKRAFRKDWEPIGTEQSGPHTSNYDKDSTDWKEMMEAIEVATGLPNDSRVNWWVGRAGDQKTVATVSDSNQDTIYRVHLEWIENEGWKPTLVEELIENDQADRYSN